MPPASVPEFLVEQSRASPARNERLVAILGSRRAALAFAAIVFVATLVQVLPNPLAFLAQDPAAWDAQHPVVGTLVVMVLGVALQAATLLLSSVRPVLAVLGSLAVYLVLIVVISSPNWLSGMTLVVAVALFLLASQRPAGVAVTWWAVTVAIDLVVLWVWAAAVEPRPTVAASFVLAQVVAFAAPAAGATALGVWWGSESRRVRHAREEAEAARREHDERVLRAREHERARIAQELHDVAGQHLSGLITLADAAVAVGPERAEAMLQLVEDVRAEGRFAAASLYGALAELKTVENDLAEVTQDLRRASELVDFWRRRGAHVELRVHGTLSDLPAVVSTTAYRGVQEALTNAAKYASGAPVGVAIDSRDDALRVSVENGVGAAERGAHERLGLGWGLNGLRERVELVGGSVAAGPTPEGGWRVEIFVPLATGDMGAKEAR